METPKNNDSFGEGSKSPSKESSEGSSPPYSPPPHTQSNHETSKDFQRSQTPSPERTFHPEPSPPLEDVMQPPTDHPSPWVMHPIVDGSIQWGEVTPSRATEMIRASKIARYFGDRKKLGLPEKPPIDALESMKEAEVLHEIKKTRGKAIQEIKCIQKKIQQLKPSPESIAGVQPQEIVGLLTSLTDNFHVAFGPNPKLPPEAIDPEMAYLFTDLVNMYTAQLYESMRLMSRIARLIEEDVPTHKNRDQRPTKIRKSSNSLEKPISFAKVPDVRTKYADWNDYKCRSCEIPTSSDSSKPSLSDPIPPPVDRSRMFSMLHAQNRSALGPVIGRIGHYLATGASTLQQNEHASIGNSTSEEREWRLQQDMREANIEARVLGSALEVVKKDRSRLKGQVDRMSRDQVKNGQIQAQVEIYRLKHEIVELRKRNEMLVNETATNERRGSSQLGKEATLRAMLYSVESGSDHLDAMSVVPYDQSESEQVDAVSEGPSDQSMRDVNQLETLEDKVLELQRQINTLKDEIQDVQRERDMARKTADAAERRIHELQEEVDALHPGGEGVDAMQARRLRARDRQISDFIAVRDNLRAEVIRRKGRVVGARGEVIRERYNLARWGEAGRREQGGKPRIYRDQWGPEGEDNLLRAEWPPEYQPGSPVGDRHDGTISEVVLVNRLQRALKLLDFEWEEAGNVTEDGDKIEEVLARLWFEITTAYQGVREMFPEMELGGRQCLAGLARIIREKREEVVEEINGLRAKNTSLALKLRDLEDHLKDGGIRGGGKKSSLDKVDGEMEEDPRPSIPRSPSPNNNPTGLGNVEDEECGQSSSSGYIPESLRYDSSGSTYTPPCSPPNSSPQRWPWFSQEDGEDPGNPGITGQGVVPVPAGQEPVELEMSGEEGELHGIQMPKDIQQGSSYHGRHRVIASGDVRKARLVRRRSNRGPKEPELNSLGVSGPDSTTVGTAQSVGCSRVFGPTSKESPSTKFSCREGRRRDSGQVEPDTPLGANCRRHIQTQRAPPRAGTRATRNPAPVYCAPLQRKRKAAEPGEGEPPKKR